MEKNVNIEKAETLEVDFDNETQGKDSKKVNEESFKKNLFVMRHYVAVVFFICIIILFLFISGLSVYKSDLFIN